MNRNLLLAAAAGVFLLAGTARGQISLVHVTSCGPGPFPGTTCAIPATGSGNLIVVGFIIKQTAGSATVQSVTDNAGNSYSESGAARSFDSAANSMADIWYARNSLPGATSIVITPSAAAANAAAVIWEFSGVDPASPLDQAAVLNSQSATATPSGASVTTTAASDVIVSLAPVSGSVTGIHSGNAFTNDSALFAGGWAHLVTSSPRTYSPVWDQTPAGTYSSSTAAFKTAGGVSACDLNADATVDILDVQLATSMNMGAMPCAAPAGFCTTPFVQAEINTALGQACSLPVVGAPASVNFGNVLVGATGTQTVTVSVTGTGTTTISQAAVTGAGFALSGPALPLSLAAGQSAAFTVTFTPAAAAAASGSLSLVSNALDSPVTVAFSGAGVTSLPHSVSLSWTASTSSNIAGYNVYRGTVSGGPYTKLNSALVSGTTYTDTAVVSGQTYYYVATAVDSSNNESSYSNQATATVPSP